MALFDKKNCAICGAKIGLVGNRKLDDGNLCKDCAAKLSPWFSERRNSTVAQIEEQLIYRENNQAMVEAFQTTRSIGQNTKVLIDENAEKFIVSRGRSLGQENPDVLDLTQVTSCMLDLSEGRSELKRKDADGTEKSYVPPRYAYTFDFNIQINVNHPWFDVIRFKLNNSQIKIEPLSTTDSTRFATMTPADIGRTSADYRECEAMAEEIVTALTRAQQVARERIVAASTPRQAVICPFCRATTTPDTNGRCEYCGGAVGAA